MVKEWVDFYLEFQSLGVLDAQTSPGVLDCDDPGQRLLIIVMYSFIHSKHLLKHLPTVGPE